jgi:hypothetical protein
LQGYGAPRGYSRHLIIGRLARAAACMERGEAAVRLTVAACVKAPAGGGAPGYAWCGVILRGAEAESFLRKGFRQGDPVGFRTSALEAVLRRDARGVARASLEGEAERFWDLREPPLPRSGLTNPDSLSQGAPGAPKKRTGDASGWRPLSYEEYVTWERAGRPGSRKAERRRAPGAGSGPEGGGPRP